VKIRYFAWVRERVGRAEEEIAIPADVTTIATLVAFLKTRGEEYQAAFANETVVRAAINHAHVRPDAPIANAHEIAFFPPMTGG
jgi:molybdopterin synthase sulfur carrier subunit